MKTKLIALVTSVFAVAAIASTAIAGGSRNSTVSSPVAADCCSADSSCCPGPCCEK